MRKSTESKPNTETRSRDAISPDVGKATARRKISAAEKATTLILEGKNGATNAIAADSVNGHGILRDPQATRNQLEKARALIQAAISMLVATDWPTDGDYDQF